MTEFETITVMARRTRCSKVDVVSGLEAGVVHVIRQEGEIRLGCRCSRLT